MRITAIREAVVPISSPIRNAYIDFSKMTANASSGMFTVLCGEGFGRVCQEGGSQAPISGY